MNLKNKAILFLILGIISFGLFSCSDDDPVVDPGKGTAQLSDVTLKQTVNDKETLELTEVGTEMIFASVLTFADKEIKWSKPTIEQSFPAIFNVSKDNVTVTDKDGTKVTTADITVDQNNNVKVAFTKVEDSFTYMEAATFNITIKTALKEGITDEELTEFTSTGYSGKALFYGESADQSVKSNEVKVSSTIVPEPVYNVKGDPNNDQYKYKLNIVYFVASDITPNPNYQERISTILLKHQLFFMKWMDHWGYGKKSYGLPLDENGMVEIVTVNGAKTKAEYPYSSSVSVGPMKEEINKHYADNGLTFLSEHTLVITATNASIDETPFYGSGRWCFALDYPGMSYEQYNIEPTTGEAMNSTPLTNSLIGGLLHELGHGLNAPHIGPTYTQKNDPQFGTPLMGPGNMSYGKTPTYMHEASAAFWNNCQITSTVEKTFYDNVTASVAISSVTINGGQCTVKGTFEASKNVTNVLLNFHDARQTHLQSDGGYNSVGWVTKPNGKNFEFTIPIEELKVNTSFSDYKLGVTILMENGTRKAVGHPSTYTLVQSDGSYTLQTEDITNDGTWEVTVSHKLPKDDAIQNAPGSLVDNNTSTSLSMVKPGKSYDGIKVDEGDIVWAIVNFKKQIEFNTVVLINRNFQTYLNAKAVSFYGSNDNVTFTPIKLNAELPENVQNIVTLDTTVKYQYLKMTYDKWEDQGSTMQFAELSLVNKK